MPNRTTLNERDKLDHASHPTTHSTADDLRAPGGGTTATPPKRGEESPPRRRSVQPPRK
jgi:hypothetical protein